MKIGLIHALTASVGPIEKAFNEVAPEVELAHVMDTELLTMMKRDKTLSPEIIHRFSKAVHLASEADVDCIQLTCSAFNDITAILQPMSAVKLFRSDEAVLDLALHYDRIGLIATVEETPPVLMNYLRQKKKGVQVETMVNTNALQALGKGDQKGHDKLVMDMMETLESKVDVIVLPQYSLSNIPKKIPCSVPVLTGPKESARRCISHLQAGIAK